MYLADYDNKMPLVSGFGPELDKHKVLWGADGTIFNRRKSGLKYMPELIYPYIKNRKMLICPVTGPSGKWKVPDGEAHLPDSSYMFNAWCVKDTSKTPPAGCVVVAGRKAEKCFDPSEAPIVWDAISGYGVLAHDDSVNVLYLDWHVKNDSRNIDQTSSYWRTVGAEGWVAPPVNTK